MSSTKEVSAAGSQLKLKVFKFEERGRAPVAALLERLRPAAPPADSQTILQWIAPQLDMVSNEMTPRLINIVKEAGGDGSHILFALSHVVARVMRRTFKPEDQKRVLEEIVRLTVSYFERMSP